MPRAIVNGIDMHYEQSGQGAPLVLVHGLGTGSSDWAFQMPALAARYRVIAPSLRGFGQSEKPAGPYSIGLYAEDLRALLDHLDVDSCHICGVSMGGAIAFQFAIDYPQRIRSLITINSQPSFELNTVKKRVLITTRVLMARLLGLQRLSRIMARRNFPGRQNRQLRRQLAGRFKNELAPYLAGLDALSGWTVVDQLDRITIPVLFIAAEFDYSSPAEKARYANLLSDARVEVIAGAHHATHLEYPDQINATILSFLDQVNDGPVT